MIRVAEAFTINQVGNHIIGGSEVREIGEGGRRGESCRSLSEGVGKARRSCVRMQSSGTVIFFSCVFALRVLERMAQGLWLGLSGQVGKVEAFLACASNIGLLSSVLWTPCGVQTRSGLIAGT